MGFYPRLNLEGHVCIFGGRHRKIKAGSRWGICWRIYLLGAQRGRWASAVLCPPLLRYYQAVRKQVASTLRDTGPLSLRGPLGCCDCTNLQKKYWCAQDYSPQSRTLWFLIWELPSFGFLAYLSEPRNNYAPCWFVLFERTENRVSGKFLTSSPSSSHSFLAHNQSRRLRTDSFIPLRILIHFET